MPLSGPLSRWLAGALVAGAALFVTPADATSALLMSRSELVAKSDYVVRATVVDAQSGWSEDGTAIVTHTRLRVLKAVKSPKGKAPTELVVEQMGGTVDDKTMVVSGDARLEPGEEVVVMLKQAPGGYVNLTALAQSAFHVRDGKARRELHGLSLFVRLNGKLVHAPPPNEASEPVDALMTNLARAARGGAK